MLSFTSVFGGDSSGEMVQMPGSEVGGGGGEEGGRGVARSMMGVGDVVVNKNCFSVRLL